MNQRTSNRQFPASNPIANVIVVLVGAIIIGAMIILGVVAFVALGGIILVLAAAMGIRLWWFDRRRAKHSVGESRPPGSGEGQSSVIEGDYKVVSERREEREGERRTP